ncbi:hypothetical protein [Methylosinus sp. Sm6]|uniref:hypothetical protein n=1 Tax=Methylosinus sp. Sm6 TaxID=2866948 RepID=UPI001C990EB1|nr:hypothetical protein [Methylosinus sp. Sm6]MBY6243130.1 hypothetical protein [Methylosinus sp. Sm6]
MGRCRYDFRFQALDGGADVRPATIDVGLRRDAVAQSHIQRFRMGARPAADAA